MQDNLFRTACTMAALSVALGAFAAHGLKAKISIDQLQIFQTGVRYQFYHTFGIFMVALLMLYKEGKWLKRSAWAFIIGIILFSGSLYLLACRDWLGISDWTWLGPLTPIGGISFILGWIFLFLSVPNLRKE